MGGNHSGDGLADAAAHGHSICVVIVQSLSDPTNALAALPCFRGRSPVSCPLPALGVPAVPWP